MKKLSQYFWAKAIAMILCIGCVFGAGATLLGLNICSRYREGELLERLYENAADNYSAAIVDHYINDGEQNQSQALTQFEGTGFQYAVIESNSMELNGSFPINWGEYLYGTKETAAKYKYHYVSAELGAQGRYEYDTNSLLAGLDGGSFIYYAQYATSVGEQIIRDIVYVKNTGLFYVITDEGYYLIRDFFIESHELAEDSSVISVWSYQGSYREGLGQSYYMDDENRIIQLDLSQDNYLILDGCDEPLYIAREESVLSSDAEDAFLEAAPHTQTMNLAVWNTQEVSVIDRIPEGANIEESGYLGISGSILRYYVEDEKKNTYYHVLSYVDEDSIKEGDLFNQALVMANGFTFIRRFGILLEILFVVLGIASFAFLLQAAGRRKGQSELAVTIFHRMPFELYTFIMGGIECLLLGGIMVFLDEFENDFLLVHLVLIAVQVVVIMGILGLIYCMNLAVRVKSKKFWDYTIIYPIIKKCLSLLKRVIDSIKARRRRLVDGYHKLLDNQTLFRKMIFFYGIWFVIEISSFVVFYEYGRAHRNPGFTSMIWLIANLIIQAVILWKILLQANQLREGARRIASGDFTHAIDTSNMYHELKAHGEDLNAVGDGISLAVAKQMKSEHFKTELITNVSHDIKTPLTSIINYVDLLKKEEISSEKATEYIEVLDRQSNRLKKLIEDLMEASKASTGNLAVNLEKLEADVFLVQTVGEFEEKLKASGLELIVKKPEESVSVLADSRHFWRVIDNLMNNICKYAQPQTRVYVDLEVKDEQVFITFKNTSKFQLNISSEELMERFVRGDSSRNTEGNGLGLNIAKSLMELMKGDLQLMVDGDLFKVVLIFQK